MGWKEKPHQQMQKKVLKDKQGDDDLDEFQREILRMQGLVICNSCAVTYGLYQARCPRCNASNKTHYPSKL